MDNPDRIVPIEIDKRTIPTGVPYQIAGYEARQVIDIKISRLVTEYREQIIEDPDGNRYVAELPPEVLRARETINYPLSSPLHPAQLRCSSVK